jgi:hypothetical protein
MMAEKVEI